MPWSGVKFPRPTFALRRHSGLPCWSFYGRVSGLAMVEAESLFLFERQLFHHEPKNQLDPIPTSGGEIPAQVLHSTHPGIIFPAMVSRASLLVRHRAFPPSFLVPIPWNN